MNKKLFLSFLCLFYSLTTFCQQADYAPFTLEGTIKLKTGDVKLEIIGDTSYYPPALRNLTAPIYSGNFHFKGKLPNPMGYMLHQSTLYYSKMIIVQAGEQTVICNINAESEIPIMDNEEMKAYTYMNKAYAKIRLEAKEDSLLQAQLMEKNPYGLPDSTRIKFRENNIRRYDDGDKAFLQFIKNYPSSYLGFWHLVHLNMFGYYKIFDEMFANFSVEIKNSYSGKILASNLKKAGLLAVGVKFPQLRLLDLNEHKSATLLSGKNKYTLVNFWNSRGTQSTRDFPALTQVYNKYKALGFEILNIATSNFDEEAEMHEAIKTTGIKWPQYWDKNGAGAKSLLVYLFPMSYLLDNQGMIIKRNVRSQELADFLKNNLQ